MASYQAWQQQHPHNVPPPFQGAPPIPSGVNVAPNHWNQGTWLPNPLYNPQATRSNVNVAQWMPGNGWGIQQPNVYYPAYPQQQQQQQQQSFNPYKRQPKPPSAEYLALKLSDNPLGLTNMVPAEEVERQERERLLQEQENHAKVTPWLWAPRQLDEEEDADHHADDTRKPPTPQIPDNPEPFASKATLQPTFSSNIIRTPQHYRSNTPVQIYASPRRSLDRGPSVDNLASDIGRLSTGSNSSAPLIRHHSMPATFPANYPATASSITGETLTREPDPMELLSPLAGVLPPPKSGSASRSNPGRHSSVPVASNSTSLDPIPESSVSKSTSHSRSHTPSPLNHRHYEPNQSASSHSRSKSTSRSNSASPYSNEQSPVSPTYAYSSSSGHSPYHPHHPSSSSSSPSYPQDPLIRNPLPAPPRPYEHPRSTESNHHHASPGTSNSTYAYMPPTTSAPPPPPPSSSNTRSRSSSTAAAAASSYTQSTPTTLANYKEEPGTVVLHANGKSTVINLSSTSSPHEIASLTHPPPTAAATTTPTKTSTPAPTTAVNSPKRRKKSKHQYRRKGFWNRRGDHVTADGYIVYAPHDQVYPPELDGYPDGKDEGYMNEDGVIASWHKRPAYNPPRGYSSVESVSFFRPSTSH